MMDTMKQEMCCEGDSVVWKITTLPQLDFYSGASVYLLVEMKETSVEAIFDQRPYSQTS